MSAWKATVRVWPFSTGDGEQSDRDAVGGKEHVAIYVEGDDIKRALHEAELYASGVRSNPRVWKCDVVALELETLKAEGHPGRGLGEDGQ